MIPMIHISTPSPLGELHLLSDGSSLKALTWDADLAERWRAVVGTCPVLEKAVTQLNEYFAGARRDFELPLDPSGTEFQRRAWKQLCEIPFGKTWSYRQQAVAMGQPAATRAVGGANNKNPLPVIIPCHRVIGADGSLTGYGGGLSRKRILLEIEGII